MNSLRNSKKDLLHFCVFHPSIVISTTILITLVCAYLSLNIQKNTTPYFLDKTHKERMKEDSLADSFLRTKETVVIVLTHKRQTEENSKQGDLLFNQTTLDILGKLQTKLIELDLIDSLLNNNKLLNQHKLRDTASRSEIKQSLIKQYNSSLSLAKTADERRLVQKNLGQFIYPVRSVKSLVNADNIFMEEDDIVVAPSFTQDKIESDKTKTKHDILNNPLFLDSLINKESDTLSVHVELEIDPDDSKAITDIFNKIKSETTAILKHSDMTAAFAGSPVVNVAISDIMEKDNQRYFPLIILLISLSLFCLYRSVWAPVLSLLVAVITIVITFGLMSLLGITLNIVTTILPIFIITIGVTDAIHILSKSEFDSNCDYRLTIIERISTLFKAMLLTSLTTSLGFFSLSFTDITNIRDFGVMVGISALIAFIVSVTTLPALLVKRHALISPSRAKLKGAHQQPSNFYPFSSLISRARNLSTRAYFVILAGLILFSLGGLPHFYVDQQNLGSFNAKTEVRQDNLIINNKLGGTVPITIWITSQTERGVLDPELLGAIANIQSEALKHDIVGYTVSINDFINYMNEILIPENKNTHISNLNQELVSQILFLLEGGPSRDLETVSDIANYKQARIVLMVKTDSSREIQILLDNLEQTLQRLPDNANYKFAGYGNMNAVAAKEIVHGQLMSIATSIFGLLFIISFLYKSVSIGLISLFPLTMSLLAMFGLMGYASIPLDIGSSLLCGVAFGIGIDYSIHIIESYKRMLPSSTSTADAIDKALSDVSFPILTSAITIALGFSILMLSDFKPIFNLGLLISITMLVSALCALFIIPRLLQSALPHKMTPIDQQDDKV